MVGNQEKFVRIARIFGEPVEGLSLRAAADAGVAAVDQLLTDVAAPRRPGDYGVTEEELPAPAEEAMTSGNIAVNPRITTANDLVGIMRRRWTSSSPASTRSSTTSRPPGSPEDGQEVLMPGEIESRTAAARARDGVPLSPDVVEALQRVAPAGLPLPQGVGSRQGG